MSHAATDIHQRLERWRQTRDARYLWPGLQKTEFRAAVAEIGRVTRACLAGARPEPVRLESAVSPRALGVAAFSSGMGPLLGSWVESGQLAAAPDFAAVLAEHLAHGRARSAMLDQALYLVLDALRERGIDIAVLKGTHTGRVYFSEPGTRPVADIDLLVERDDFEPACQTLSELGFRRGTESLDGPRIEWIPRDSDHVPFTVEMEHERNPWAVDLHGSLDRMARYGVRSRFGSPRPAGGEMIEHNARRFYVLPQPLLLTWLAAHTANHLETSPLIRYVELVLVIRRDFAPRPGLWEQLLGLVDQAVVGRLVYPAFELAEKLAPGSVPRAVRERLRRSAPRLMRRVVAHLEPETAQQMYRLGLPLWLMWATSARELLALLTGDVVPGRSGLQVLIRRLRMLARRAV